MVSHHLLTTPKGFLQGRPKRSRANKEREKLTIREGN